MGSSFAAGPGIAPSADTPPNRCGRSAANYAHQLAKARALLLTDVSCGGATISDILTGSKGLAPQIDAIGPDTRLVTVTIGGNDLGYLGFLHAASCRRLSPSGSCPPPAEANPPRAYIDVEAHLTQLAQEVHRRAPAARLVFVQYFAILPPKGVCAATPLSDAQADQARDLARRLARATSRAAIRGRADVLALHQLSVGHDACAKQPWVNGAPANAAARDGVDYHPTLAGMTAAADALDRLLAARIR